MGFGRALPAGLIGLAAASFMSANGVHNAGITWSSSAAIYAVNVDGSGRHVLVRPFADQEGDPAWTRDGRALAFFGRNSDDVSIHIRRLGTHRERVIRPDYHYHSKPYPVCSVGYLLEPTWSPAATRIAVSDACIGDAATIRTVSLATTKWTSVTKPRRHVEDIDPAWCPDGGTIAFARRVHGGTPTLYLVRPDGAALRRLTKGRSPSWSPDGTRLAFTLGGSVYEIRADGRGHKRIVGGLRNPVVRWSPDGRKLLYTSGSYSASDVWTADVDGTHRRRILHRVAIDGIAWRPGS